MDEVPVQPQPQVTTTPKPHNWKKVILTVVFIVGVVAVVSGIYWFMVVNKTSDNSDLTGPVPKVTTKTSTESAKKSTPSAEKDETVDWKTFTYENPKISFKYPKSWFINVEPEVNNEGNFSVSISNYNPADIKNYPSDLPNKWVLLEVFASKKSTTSGSENSKLYEFISSQSLNNQVEKDKFYLVKTKSFQLDSYSAVRYTSEPTSDAGTEYYFRDNVLVNKGSLIWKVDILSPDKSYVKKNSEVFDQLLSTFKFLD